MPVTRRPKLPSLATPTSGNFPADALRTSDALLSASSVRTPHSASLLKGSLPSAGLYSAGLPSAGLPSAPFDYPPTPSMLSATKQEDMPEKTPITPPLAYMDFLKSISVASPTVSSPPLTAPLMSKTPLHRTSTSGSTASTASTTSTASTASTATCKTEDSASDSNAEADHDSAPTSASTSSGATDCSCKCEHVHKSPKPSHIQIKQPPSPPLGNYPLSAPATGPTKFPSFRIPPSPAVDSPLRSPYSARSIKSPFDWDAALKGKRYHEVIKPPTSAVGTGGAQSPRCEKGRSVKHIREVVTRTVTYTPRMDPAPKGKRRKLE